MDRSLYVAMTGATQTMRAQTEVSHNLANASTSGFKARIAAFQSVPVLGDGLATRVNAISQGLGSDFTGGSILSTGRELDVAVQGSGWIAVQAPDGGEAYTRAGDLRVDESGLLTTANGLPVLGDGGAITVPPYSKLDIGSDGSVVVVPQGQSAATVAAVGKLKLVNPDVGLLEPDGNNLMRLRDGGVAEADPGVRVAGGMLEASNVNPSEMLVKMISLSRQFDLQMQGIRNADTNAQSATRLLQAM
jgi:flagellar basal-body rod protein FlgF